MTELPEVKDKARYYNDGFPGNERICNDCGYKMLSAVWAPYCDTWKCRNCNKKLDEYEASGYQWELKELKEFNVIHFIKPNHKYAVVVFAGKGRSVAQSVNDCRYLRYTSYYDVDLIVISHIDKYWDDFIDVSPVIDYLLQYRKLMDYVLVGFSNGGVILSRIMLKYALDCAVFISGFTDCASEEITKYVFSGTESTNNIIIVNNTHDFDDQLHSVNFSERSVMMYNYLTSKLKVSRVVKIDCESGHTIHKSRRQLFSYLRDSRII